MIKVKNQNTRLLLCNWKKNNDNWCCNDKTRNGNNKRRQRIKELSKIKFEWERYF